jgi:NADH:ubiquinone oxidoreductase subunit 3 (subunit A)
MLFVAVLLLQCVVTLLMKGVIHAPTHTQSCLSMFTCGSAAVECDKRSGKCG